MTEIFTEENIQTIVRNTARLIEENYPFQEVPQKMSLYNQEKLSKGSLENIKDPRGFTQHLPKELKKISHDLHV